MPNKHTEYTIVPTNPLITLNQWRAVADKFKWTNLDFKPRKSKLKRK